MIRVLRLSSLCGIVALVLALQGCVLAAAGAGAAGGYVAKQHGYGVQSPVKKDKAGGYKAQSPVTHHEEEGDQEKSTDSEQSR